MNGLMKFRVASQEQIFGGKFSDICGPLVIIVEEKS